jgi:hypothetical protein
MKEKDFIPYEIALELKQLGFDESCFGYYDIYDEAASEHIIYIQHKIIEYMKQHKYNNLYQV